MFARTGLAPILLLASFSAVMAQETTPGLEAGDRVRVTFPCDRALGTAFQPTGRVCRSDGRLALLTRDTIVIAAGNSTTAHSLESVSRVEVGTGTKSHWLPGAAIGFAVGWTAAYVALSSGGSTSTCDQSANQDAVSVGECVALSALVGGVPGFGLGALVGIFIRSERWQDVPLDRVRVSAGSGPGDGLRLTVSITH